MTELLCGRGREGEKKEDKEERLGGEEIGG